MIFKVLPNQNHPEIPRFYEILPLPVHLEPHRWVRAAPASSRLTAAQTELSALM